MAIDIRRVALAAARSALEDVSLQATSKRRLSAGKALLVGAGLVTAGRLAAGSRGSELVEEFQRRFAPNGHAPDDFDDNQPEDEFDDPEEASEEDEEDDDEESDEDEEDRDDDPEAEADEDQDEDDEPDAEAVEEEPEAEAEEDEPEAEADEDEPEAEADEDQDEDDGGPSPESLRRRSPRRRAAARARR